MFASSSDKRHLAGPMYYIYGVFLWIPPNFIMDPVKKATECLRAKNDTYVAFIINRIDNEIGKSKEAHCIVLMDRVFLPEGIKEIQVVLSCRGERERHMAGHMTHQTAGGE